MKQTKSITTTVTVTNNGTNVLKNVHIQYDIPEKYELANGSKMKIHLNPLHTVIR